MNSDPGELRGYNVFAGSVGGNCLDIENSAHPYRFYGISGGGCAIGINLVNARSMEFHGASFWSNATARQNLTVILTVPGDYGYRCTPHGTLGMVGLIVVGAPVNEARARAAAMPGIAGRVFSKLFEALDTQRTAGN